MGFWLRQILFGIILVVLAATLILFQDELFGHAEADLDTVEQKAESIKNKAAEGLSKFYASLNPGDDKDGPVIKNNVVYLPEPTNNLDTILEERSLVVRPIRNKWEGTKESRPFRTGETLFQKITEFANAEGIEVIWQLDKDFVVKDAFRVDKSIINTAIQIGGAITGHFENGVKVYFCNKQRTIVFTDKPTDFLIDKCKLLEKTQD